MEYLNTYTFTFHEAALFFIKIPADTRYSILQLHGGLKKQELNKIRKFFCITKELADFDTDFHYTMDDVGTIIK